MRRSLAYALTSLIVTGALGFGCGETFNGDDDEPATGGERNTGGSSGASGGPTAGQGAEGGESTGGTTGGSDAGRGGAQAGTGRGGSGDGGDDAAGMGGSETGGSGMGGTGGAGSGGMAGGGVAGGGVGGGSGAPSVPPSCRDMLGNECQGGSCCESPLVPGGPLAQGEPDAFDSTVSSFRMDRYEVTVNRFRRFVAGYEAWRIQGNPTAGAGAHPQIASSGWNATWSQNLPSSATALTSIVKCNTDYASWTDDEPVNDTEPMNCVSWYEAFAFCIWDGGRLPTEAEWEYAAVGGSNDTVYPWGNTPVPDGIDGSYAVYNCLGDGMTGCAPPDIRPVGTKPLGRGRYLHRDLAGSIWEWVFDSFAAYPTTARSNYANVDMGATRVARGGHWSAAAADLRSATRHARDPGDRYYGIYGMRCARTP